ncbi:MAG: DUF4386 domain-containing protein [Methanomassiliicoccus sp.]|nr:DUF4386 domain-containing protein [Methanomassiliicoccus sp.]
MTERCHRKTAAIVGALFIIATAASLASAPFLGSALEGSDYILRLSATGNNMVIASVLEIILAISVVAIGVLMLPILRKRVDGLGTAYAGIRLVEAIFIVASAVSLLYMLSAGQDYAAGRLDETRALSMGASLISLREWSLIFGTLIFLGIGGLTLNYGLYRSKLVPRWLSTWGIVGGVCILIYGAMGVFGTDTSSFDATTLLALPIAVQEMVFASWLIVKGFDTPTNVDEKRAEMLSHT